MLIIRREEEEVLFRLSSSSAELKNMDGLCARDRKYESIIIRNVIISKE